MKSDLVWFDVHPLQGVSGLEHDVARQMIFRLQSGGVIGLDQRIAGISRIQHPGGRGHREVAAQGVGDFQRKAVR